MLALFEMLQAGVDHLFDTAQFGSPGFLSVIEPSVDGGEFSVHVGSHITEARVHIVEARVHIIKTGVHIAQPRVVDQDSHQYGDCRDSNGKSDLNLIGHYYLQDTLQ